MSGQFLWDSKANISLLQSGYCIFFISVQPRVSCRAPKSGSGVSSNSSHDISSASDLPFSPHEIRVKQRVCAERKKILLPSVNKQPHYSIVQCWRRAACVPVQPWIPSSTGGTMKRLPFFFFFEWVTVVIGSHVFTLLSLGPNCTSRCFAKANQGNCCL